MTDTNNPIPPLTRDDAAAHSGDVVAENVAALKALFPQIVTDGKVDFEVLRQLLGDSVEAGEERYGLNWKGKAKARAHALTPTLATLRPTKADSVDWDTTQNLVIEGDNLEVLKCLRKAYAGKVKLIYIDPPYNTGKDFVYPDNYTDSLSNYLALTGQRGEDGAQLTSNKEASGRFHTDWLNMIYPRLMLARDLLNEAGWIAVSCDDSEVSRLIAACDEIFGSENAIANVIWQKKYTRANDAEFFSDNHDFVVIYCKNRNLARLGRTARSDDQNAAYSNPDNHPKGPWKATPLHARSGTNTLPYTFQNGVTWAPPIGTFRRFNDDAMSKMDAQGEIWFGANGQQTPSRKTFLCELADGVVPVTIWDYKFAGSNHDAANELDALGVKGAFTSPKPTSLIEKILELTANDPSDVVLDFFAGSGTTYQSVIQANVRDSKARKCILVQLPEPLDAERREQKVAADFCDKLGKPRNIAELTKERLRRAGAKVKADNPGVEVDTGFRVYKLDTSNLKPWQPDADNLEASLLDAVSNIVHGRSEDDLLVELLLKTGIDLTTPEELRQIAGKNVHALGGGALIVCLADIADGDAEALAHGMADWWGELEPAGQTTFYFKDTGFASASAKANVAAILRQRLGDRIAKLASI